MDIFDSDSDESDITANDNDINPDNPGDRSALEEQPRYPRRDRVQRSIPGAVPWDVIPEL